MFFRPRYQMKEVSPKVVGFFFAQYVEVMKHGTDKTDARLKEYLFQVVTGLGVPLADIEMIEDEEDVVPDPAEQSLPIIHRRN